MDATRRSLRPFSTRTIEPRKKRCGSKEHSEESDFSKLPGWSLIPCIRFRKFFGCGSTGRTFSLPRFVSLRVIGYVLSRLGLPAYIDYSLASRYLAFDIRQRRWSDGNSRRHRNKCRMPARSGACWNDCRKIRRSRCQSTRSLAGNDGGDGRARSTLRRIGSWRDRCGPRGRLDGHLRMSVRRFRSAQLDGCGAGGFSQLLLSRGSRQVRHAGVFSVGNHDEVVPRSVVR